MRIIIETDEQKESSKSLENNKVGIQNAGAAREIILDSGLSKGVSPEVMISASGTIDGGAPDKSLIESVGSAESLEIPTRKNSYKNSGELQ